MVVEGGGPVVLIFFSIMGLFGRWSSKGTGVRSAHIYAVHNGVYEGVLLTILELEQVLLLHTHVSMQSIYRRAERLLHNDKKQ